MKTSKIATIVYANYTENVDMLNPLFKQSELDALKKSDKSILRIEYYFDSVLVGTKLHSEKYALAQVIKMNETQANIYRDMETEGGADWYAKANRNKRREEKIAAIYVTIGKYKPFISEEGYYNSKLSSDMCCDYADFKND